MARRRRKAYNRKPGIRKGSRLYPVIRCVNQDLIIAVSYKPLDIYKVQGQTRQSPHKDTWKEGNCKFRKGYEIDFSIYEKGDVVRCPRCHSGVDFMAFPSATIPDILDED